MICIDNFHLHQRTIKILHLDSTVLEIRDSNFMFCSQYPLWFIVLSKMLKGGIKLGGGLVEGWRKGRKKREKERRKTGRQESKRKEGT